MENYVRELNRLLSIVWRIEHGPYQLGGIYGELAINPIKTLDLDKKIGGSGYDSLKKIMVGIVEIYGCML